MHVEAFVYESRLSKSRSVVPESDIITLAAVNVFVELILVSKCDRARAIRGTVNKLCTLDREHALL